jgi:hypothetical protein
LFPEKDVRIHSMTVARSEVRTVGESRDFRFVNQAQRSCPSPEKMHSRIADLGGLPERAETHVRDVFLEAFASMASAAESEVA